MDGQYFPRDRGQAYSLEGIASALLLLLSLLFALNSILITPATPGTLDRETRAQLSTQADDALSAASTNGSLREIVRYWNTSQELPNRTFYTPDPSTTSARPDFGYGQDDPPGEFGRILNQTFSQRGLTYNVVIEYRLASDWSKTNSVVLVKRGVPTNNAVSATTTLTVFDTDTITAPSSGETLADETAFYASDIDPGGPLYNVLTVRVVVW
jgi:hypothetical protein